MKKLLCLVLFLSLNSAVLAATTYQYQGYTDNFSFNVKFPSDWRAKTFGDDLQGFSPVKEQNPLIFIKEFENLSYNEAISTYIDQDTELRLTKDIIFKDYPAKEIIFYNKIFNQKYAVTFVKRGGLILAISNPNLKNSNFPIPEKHNAVVREIYNSFAFNDNWSLYIDQENQFSLNLPPGFKAQKAIDGIDLLTTEKRPRTIFHIAQHKNLTIKEIVDSKQIKALEINKISFNGHNGSRIVFKDQSSGQKFAEIFLENRDSIFVLPDLNIEEKFPHKKQNNQYLKEILASFEFFNLEKEYKTYLYFSDIPDSHTNKDAINSLYEQKIIAGFENQTFRPDDEVTRAELVKMLAITANPDPKQYQNCFPDVKNEWYAPFICYAKEKRWIDGYPDGRFHGTEGINRAEAIKIILASSSLRMPHKVALKNTAVADIRRGEWFSRYFNFADNQQFLDKQHIETDGTVYWYFPQNKMTRKEVAEMLYRISKK